MALVLGAFEQAVLLAVVRLRDNAYGRRVLGDVRVRLRREVPASRLESGDEVREGRPRRAYSILKAGIRALNESRAMVDHIWHGIRRPLKGTS